MPRPDLTGIGGPEQLLATLAGFLREQECQEEFGAAPSTSRPTTPSWTRQAQASTSTPFNKAKPVLRYSRAHGDADPQCPLPRTPSRITEGIPSIHPAGRAWAPARARRTSSTPARSLAVRRPRRSSPTATILAPSHVSTRVSEPCYAPRACWLAVLLRLT